MFRRICRVGFVLGSLLLLVSSAQAVITAKLPLAQLLRDSQIILVTKVEKLYPEKPALVLTVTQDLKGTAPIRRLPINAKGDDEATKGNHIPQLMKRLAPDLPVLLFVNQRGKNYNAFAFTNGTWFHLSYKQTGEPSEVAWSLTHGEPYLRRTFKGTTAELRQIVTDALANKAKPPDYNEKEVPGFGPEVSPASSGRLHGGGRLFAVIPTLGVGGPLAILALLFPAVFGGVLILFRQWVAFITVLSLNSTLLLVLWLFPNLARGSAWNNPPVLWSTMTLVTLLGTIWAWRRQLTQLTLGPLALEVPRKTEYTVLAVLAGSMLALVAGTLFIAPSRPEAGDLAWNLTLVLAAGIWGGALYRLYRHYFGTQPLLATEGVMLGSSTLAWIVLGLVLLGGGRSIEGHVATTHAVVEKRWEALFKGDSGLVVSTTLIDGDRLYAAAAHPTFKLGTLYCLDRHTGAEIWRFGVDDDLKQMLSSPCLADGKIYLGEGFHDDPNCKLYCIAADTGKLLWSFQTTGQTESSPCVAAGKVYGGGGNDGLYCLDAADGKKLWLFGRQNGGRLRRFGAPPAVADGRVYCGTGIDRNEKKDPGETAIFCLDASTGKRLWHVPTTLPCWGAPVIQDGLVYVTLGNGDVFSDAESPAGQVLCLDAATGKQLWEHDLPNGVIGAPAVDAQQVYVGCRDGNVYCLGRRDGQPRWQSAMGGPVIATPALVRGPGDDLTAHVIAIAANGRVCCLDPHYGRPYWTYTLEGEQMHLSSSPRVAVSRSAEGERRQIYFGAGVGGLTTGQPVVYCLEDLVKIQ
jgi:outer membrane protein assembly factor BamB